MMSGKLVDTFRQTKAPAEQRKAVLRSASKESKPKAALAVSQASCELGKPMPTCASYTSNALCQSHGFSDPRREQKLPDLQCRLFSLGDTLLRPPPKAILHERAALWSQLWRIRNKVECASSCVQAVQMLTRWRRCGSLTLPGATDRARA